MPLDSASLRAAAGPILRWCNNSVGLARWALHVARDVGRGGLLLTIAASLTLPSNARGVVDQRGIVVEIKLPATRVVCRPPNLTYSYATVDATSEHFVGARPDVPGRLRGLLLGRVFPGLASLTKVDGVEALLNVRPDVVFDWAYAYDEVALMEEAGVPVVAMQNGETDFVTWPHIEGEATGKAARAGRLIVSYEQHLQALKDDLGDVPERGKVRVMLLSQISPQIVGVNFVHAFATASVRSALPAQRAAIGFEQILLADPTIILLFGDNVAPKELYSSPRWQAVRAVQTHRVYEIPEEWPGFNGILDEPLFGRWLAELAYPERMRKLLRTDVRESYRAAFGYNATTADIDRALRMEANRDSLGYQDRFGASR